MPHLPVLRVVPLELIRPHEDFDPIRVERLAARIADEGVQVNPMMCCESDSGDLILLDGATRTESLRRVGVPHTVVQLVSGSEVALETWHHVVWDCDPTDLQAAISTTPGLQLRDEAGTPRLHLNDVSAMVTSDELSPNSTLSALAGSYVGRWPVGRIPEASTIAAQRLFPEWAAIVEFPTLTLQDVMTAALANDLLPAGITRFLVQERALRLNVSLDLLVSRERTQVKQEKLEAMLETRIGQGRVRRYEETVVILDD